MATSSKQPEPAAHGAPVAPPATRISRARLGLAAGMLGLVVVLVFILQNLDDVKVSFFTANWRIPLGVNLLFAAILGGLVAFGIGSLRILELRKLAKERAKHPRQVDPGPAGSSPGGGAPPSR